MRLDKVELENFGAYYGKHSFKFPNGLTFLLGSNQDNPQEADSNASGKTTILHAICYALFGQTAGKVKASELVSEQCVPGERMEVMVRFGKQVTITRTYTAKGSSVVLETPEHGRIVGDVKEVDRRICEYLGITFSLFANAMYLASTSGSVQFLKLQPAARAAVLGDLVDDQVFQRAAAILKTNKSTAEHAYSRLTHEIELRKRNIQAQEQKLAQIVADLASIRVQESEGLTKLNEEITRLQRKLHDIVCANLKEPKDTAEFLEERRIDLNKRIRVNQEQIANNQPLPARIGEGERCRYCCSVVDYNTLQYIKKENEARAQELEALRQEKAVLDRDYDNIEKRITALRTWREQAEKRKSDIAELNYELAYLHRKKSETTQGSRDLERRRDEIVEAIAEEKGEIHAVVQKQLDLATEIQVSGKLVTILSSEVRNLLFDRIRGALEACTDRYLRTIAGDMLTIAYPSTDSAGREKFEITVTQEGKAPRDISTYSEGEAWRATFAILLALRDTLLQQAKCKLSVLLIDDPVGVLDITGMRRYLDVLRNMAAASSAETILVTLPRSDGLQADDSVLQVVKKGGQSFANMVTGCQCPAGA